MPLSSDPEKRAKQIENLKRGPAAAEKTFGLPVVPYADAPKTPAAKAKPAADPTPESSTPVVSDSPSTSPVIVLGVGALALVVVMLMLNKTGGPSAR